MDYTLDEDIATFALGSDSQQRQLVDKMAAHSLSSPMKEVVNGQSEGGKKGKVTVKVLPIPEEMPMLSVPVHKDKVVCFNGRDHFLSTFSKSPFEVNGIIYPNVEHYYQATKLYSLAGSRNASRLRNVNGPFQAKSEAKKILKDARVPIKEIERWKRTDGVTAVLYACAAKFLYNANLRKQLLNTGNSLLVQTHDGDNLYAVGMKNDEFLKWIEANDGKEIKIPYYINPQTVVHFPLFGNGRNLLGLICMKVRRVLQTAPEAKNPVYDYATCERLLQKVFN